MTRATQHHHNTTTTRMSLLDQAVAATKHTEPNQARELLTTLTQSALTGSVSWDKNIVRTMTNAIAEIDDTISRQLAHVMHSSEFKQLEGSWRGLAYLLNNTPMSDQIHVNVISVDKITLRQDLEKAGDFDQSQLFKKVYESEFGIAGGQPYGVLLGDYAFSNHPEDISLLRDLSSIAASAFCPFIASASASLLGFDNWSELANPRDLEKLFDTVEYAQWHSFRATEDARFVSLALPRVIARLPYGDDTKPISEFSYHEALHYGNDKQAALEHNDYCWMNACYVVGERLTHAFADHGWCTAIRGAEGGGKVSNLPLHVFRSDDGDMHSQCPTEVGITDRREAELSKLGFLPLCHYKNTDYAVIFGAQTTQQPQTYDTAEATANAAISARLPYIMATSRFAHYLKLMARDKVGSFMEAEEIEAWLNRWILQYVNANPQSKQELKAKYPLAEAKVNVEPIPGKPGAYQAVAWLRPWLQLEALTASLRLVAEIPEVSQ